MPAVFSKELDLESLRFTVRNIYTPFGHQCRRCKHPLRLSDVDSHNFHLRCPKCYTTMWCIRDGCGLCVYELGRPFVNKADVRTVPVDTHNFHLRCPKCYATMWCITDGCGLCVNELGRPFVNKADVRTVHMSV
ncbi:uncharacterized protein LOC118415271 [Branchiostoma floridae]|uniref:Uncharacterized protein LOC118415271 n=1 Tax=Branchiostoma floridae TaxID=7739 RepID=A0A9J7L579_BRAFL|nr:uncharacterized protein LOC118415271 [Branchiostoma floridae]